MLKRWSCYGRPRRPDTNGMKKPICLIVHTERLHDDIVWEKIKAVADFCYLKNIKTTWFSFNPTVEIYKKSGFDENKWKDRLNYLKEHGQSIEQHTHFYDKEKRGDNTSLEYIKNRIQEDKRWLENAGHKISGFVAGTWFINRDILSLLHELGYAYDCTARNFSLSYMKNRPNQLLIDFPQKINSITCIPVTTSLKNYFLKFWKNRDVSGNCVIYFHDYEINNFILRILLKLVFVLNKNKKFVTPLELNI